MNIYPRHILTLRSLFVRLFASRQLFPVSSGFSENDLLSPAREFETSSFKNKPSLFWSGFYHGLLWLAAAGIFTTAIIYYTKTLLETTIR